MEIFPIYVSKNTFKRHVDLLLIQEKGHSHCVLIKDLTLSCTIKHYIVIENIFVVIVYNLLLLHEINGKQMIKVAKNR